MIMYQEFTYVGDPISVDLTGYRYTDVVLSRNGALLALEIYSVNESSTELTFSFSGDAPLNTKIRVYMGYNLSGMLNADKNTYVYTIKGA